ncbi:MAG: hypothetical protein CVV13_09250 [Gammaproteobacteria bacterium HGW-Gammaproteobacteria-3]|nr:MAG: hypothetical protein CVV13_09250 [Gammaproteobacteria bacterium HGW-Gammaproteobacteria-3]
MSFRDGHEIAWTTMLRFLFGFKACKRYIVSYVPVCTKRRSWLTPLPTPVGNAENGQKDKSVAQVIKCTFLS